MRRSSSDMVSGEPHSSIGGLGGVGREGGNDVLALRGPKGALVRRVMVARGGGRERAGGRERRHDGEIAKPGPGRTSAARPGRPSRARFAPYEGAGGDPVRTALWWARQGGRAGRREARPRSLELRSRSATPRAP